MTKEIASTPQKPISQATPVQIGFVIGLLGVIVAVVWGAATMNAKLDVVLAKIGTVEANNTSLRSDVAALQVWRAEIDRSGSKAVDELKKEFTVFKTEFQIHLAQSGKK